MAPEKEEKDSTELMHGGCIEFFVLFHLALEAESDQVRELERGDE